MEWKGIYLIITLVLLNSCSKETELPLQYNGFAILQTQDLPDDGVDLYTFYLLPKVEDLAKEGIKYKRNLFDKSVGFLLPQHEEYLVYKRELNGKGWDKDEHLILVKVNYEILNTEWEEDTKIKSLKIVIEDENLIVQNYAFVTELDRKGNSLYKIKNIEFIRKIN